MNIPTYQLKLDEFDPESGISLIAIVDEPAMEVAAVKLSLEAQPHFVELKATDSHKQILTAPVIIPGKLIPRYSPKQGKFNVFFSAEDVETMLEHFMKFGNLTLSNYNHDQTDTIDAHLVEVWVVKDSKLDKAVALGYNDLPQGTLMASYKVNDSEFWKSKVLTGEKLGFSLEGLFEHLPVKFATQPEPQEADWTDLEAAITDILHQIYPDGLD